MASNVESVPEEELIDRAKGGDKKAFGMLVVKYQNMVYTLACRTFTDAQCAEDMAQNAFVRAWQALPTFKSKSKFSSWLYRITLNVCFTELRRQQKPIDIIPGEELEKVNVFGQEAEHFEHIIEKQDLVDRLIEGLPPLFRGIVVLHYLEGLDCKEISAVVGRPVGTVKAYLHRARSKLRSEMQYLLKTRSLS